MTSASEPAFFTTGLRCIVLVAVVYCCRLVAARPFACNAASTTSARRAERIRVVDDAILLSPKSSTRIRPSLARVLVGRAEAEQPFVSDFVRLCSSTHQRHQLCLTNHRIHRRICVLRIGAITAMTLSS